MQSLVNELMDFIYPPVCLVCKAALERTDRWGICSGCLHQIAYIELPFCMQCGKAYTHEERFSHLCGECLTRKRHYRRARAIGHYHGMLRTALHLFKYQLKHSLARSLGSIMTDRLPFRAPDCLYHLIIPVPLHPRRLRDRGFNQALCLASSVSRHLKVPLDRFTLKRVRWTHSQVGLTARERASNVKNAFVVCRPEAVRKKSILLVDDIFTSGSTVDECARMLLSAEAKAVEVLTLARAS